MTGRREIGVLIIWVLLLIIAASSIVVAVVRSDISYLVNGAGMILFAAPQALLEWRRGLISRRLADTISFLGFNLLAWLWFFPEAYAKGSGGLLAIGVIAYILFLIYWVYVLVTGRVPGKSHLR